MQSPPPKQFWGIRNLPNMVTCLNLFAGSIGVWLAFEGNYVGATVAVVVAALFDFLDGMLARMLNAYSEIGKQLDSLADMVSFGLLPGALVFSMLSLDGVQNYTFLAFLIPIFSAVRLAKFNIDTRQTDHFIGLPTPANALFWVGLSVSYSEWFAANYLVLLLVVVLFSYLLVAELPMFALKVKNLKLQENKVQYLFIVISLILIFWLKGHAIAPIILWYVLLSLILFMVGKSGSNK